MEIEEISDCPYPFGYYLRELTNDIIIVFDDSLKVVQCNDRFLALAALSKKEIENRKVEDLVITEDSNFPDLPDVRSYKEVNLQLSDLVAKRVDYFYTSYIFNGGSFYYLIGEERQVEDKEVLEKISLLNNALSNKSRKLAKKNKKLEKANERIEKLSKTDVLTGLANRRHFMDYFEKMISQAQRHSNPISLVMIDLDKFKDINDSYGHQAGDDVLSALGNLLSRETRKEDLAGRIGGEEFAVILTQTDIEKADNYAERIRKEINQLEVDSVPAEITASLGVSEMKDGDDSESLLKRADAALYEAKENGRNRVYTPA